MIHFIFFIFIGKSISKHQVPKNLKYCVLRAMLHLIWGNHIIMDTSFWNNLYLCVSVSIIVWRKKYVVDKCSLSSFITCLCWNMGYTHIGPLSLILKFIKISQPFYQLWQPKSNDVWWPAWQPFIKLPIRPWSPTLFSWDSSLAAPALTGRALRDNSWQKAKNLTNASYEFKVMCSTITEVCRNKVVYATVLCTCHFNLPVSSFQHATYVNYHVENLQTNSKLNLNTCIFNKLYFFFISIFFLNSHFE